MCSYIIGLYILLVVWWNSGCMEKCTPWHKLYYMWGKPHMMVTQSVHKISCWGKYTCTILVENIIKVFFIDMYNPKGMTKGWTCYSYMCVTLSVYIHVWNCCANNISYHRCCIWQKLACHVYYSYLRQAIHSRVTSEVNIAKIQMANIFSLDSKVWLVSYAVWLHKCF